MSEHGEIRYRLSAPWTRSRCPALLFRLQRGMRPREFFFENTTDVGIPDNRKPVISTSESQMQPNTRNPGSHDVVQFSEKVNTPSRARGE
jgi:hypothetical protein